MSVFSKTRQYFGFIWRICFGIHRVAPPLKIDTLGWGPLAAIIAGCETRRGPQRPGQPATKSDLKQFPNSITDCRPDKSYCGIVWRAGARTTDWFSFSIGHYWYPPGRFVRLATMVKVFPLRTEEDFTSVPRQLRDNVWNLELTEIKIKLARYLPFNNSNNQGTIYYYI